ncbi:MAG: hypothetical protein WBV06_08230 [Acidimicrobiia bacterium]
MQLRRVIKTLQARWPVIVLLAIVGAAVGAILTSNFNEGITPRFRAQAPMTFFALADDQSSSSGNSGGSTSSRNTSNSPTTATDAEAERTRAGLLLEDTLAANPRVTIQADRETNTLYFVALGRDGQQALNDAVALRAEYQSKSVTVINVDEIKATMATVLENIDAVKSQMSDLQVGDPTPEDPKVTAQRTTIEEQINELAQRQAQIGIWIDNPEIRPTESEFFGQDTSSSSSTSRTDQQTGSRPNQTEDTTVDTTEEDPVVTLEALQGEQSQNNIILFRLENALKDVPEPPVAEELDNEGSLRLEALQQDLDDLEAEYVDLLRGLDGNPPGVFPEEPIVTDETQTPRSMALTGGIGLVVGVFIAGLAIVGHDQIRKPVWATADLENVISLALVNRKRETDVEHPVWYPTALTQRRRDIQTLRTAVDAITNEQPTALGLFGVGVSREEVGELAADLAMSCSVSDRRVLLIDGSSFHPNIIPEFGDGHNALNEILMSPAPPDEAAARINSFLDHAMPSAPRLTAVHVNAELNDPVDVFASTNARIFMEAALARYEMVIIAGPDISDPLADAVMRRTELVALVGYVGVTKKAVIENAAGALSDRKAEVAGVVLLEGRRIPFSDQVRSYLRGSRDEVTAEAELDIEVDIDATYDEPSLPSPATPPSGSGRNTKAKEPEPGSIADATAEGDVTSKAANSVLQQARQRRANSRSGN